VLGGGRRRAGAAHATTSDIPTSLCETSDAAQSA
jgi:hypothetical protein